MANATAVGDDVSHWWEPNSFYLSLGTAMVSTVCWGSWSNTAKEATASDVNFAHFYVDFCLGTVLAAVIAFFSLGRGNLGREEVDIALTWFPVAAGSVFGVANLLLTTGIALAGLAVAFPLCIGTALVLGTILTYIVDGRGKLVFMIPGVFLALLGVVANARAYAALQKARAAAGGDGSSEEVAEAARASSSESEEPSSDESSDEEAGGAGKAASSAVRNMTICISGGLLMGTWAPLSARGMQGPTGLSPYYSVVCFTAAALVWGVLIVSGQQCGLAIMPRVAEVTSLKEYFQLKPLLHGWGIVGGAIWAIGTIANLVSGGTVGYALSYALGQTAPMVAVMWGLFWYNEFKGAPKSAHLWLVLMFVLFVTAIALLCLGGS